MQGDRHLVGSTLQSITWAGYAACIWAFAFSAISFYWAAGGTASASGLAAVLGTLLAFTVVTLGTFVVLTVAATLAGYQVKGEWLEVHGNHIMALVLIAIGVVVFLNLL